MFHFYNYLLTHTDELERKRENPTHLNTEGLLLAKIVTQDVLVQRAIVGHTAEIGAMSKLSLLVADETTQIQEGHVVKKR